MRELNAPVGPAGDGHLGRRYQHGVNDLHPDGTRKRNLIQIVEWMNTIIVNGFEGGTLRKVPPTNSGSGGPSRHTVSGNLAAEGATVESAQLAQQSQRRNCVFGKIYEDCR